ncbi:OsmC family protein [Spongiimicrobium sp. 3-5]|uniref:OsmC family protein n=1 Tax=Spongiimicrobium sp. 3-5 TaxID=3332596 RepID=UPI00398058EB
MKFSAFIDSKEDNHSVKVISKGVTKELQVGSGTDGFGSAINGGEFLFLAVATCFCNDLYREAKKRGITLETVRVEASGEFSAEGEPGYNLTYSAKVEGDAPKEELNRLIEETDKVAEIHNTLRKGVAVTLLKDD